MFPLAALGISLNPRSWYLPAATGLKFQTRSRQYRRRTRRTRRSYAPPNCTARMSRQLRIAEVPTSSFRPWYQPETYLLPYRACVCVCRGEVFFVRLARFVHVLISEGWDNLKITCQKLKIAKQKVSNYFRKSGRKVLCKRFQPAVRARSKDYHRVVTNFEEFALLFVWALVLQWIILQNRRPEQQQDSCRTGATFQTAGTYSEESLMFGR